MFLKHLWFSFSITAINYILQYIKKTAILNQKLFYEPQTIEQ